MADFAAASVDGVTTPGEAVNPTTCAPTAPTAHATAVSSTAEGPAGGSAPEAPLPQGVPLTPPPPAPSTPRRSPSTTSPGSEAGRPADVLDAAEAGAGATPEGTEALVTKARKVKQGGRGSRRAPAPAPEGGAEERPRKRSKLALSQTPQKPKRAKTAYAVFCEEHRPAVISDVRARNNGDLNLAELARQLSEQWSRVSAEDRVKYQDVAGKDKERHTMEMQGYIATTDPVSALTAKYADLIPKKPLPTYFLFNQDKEQRSKAEEALRAEGLEVSTTTMGARLGQMWHAAPAEVRAEFAARSERAAAEYAAKLKAWQETPECSELERAKREHGGGGKRMKRRGMRACGVQGVPPQQAQRAAQRPPVDITVLAEAKELGLADPLVELAERGELRERGYYARHRVRALALLGALKRCDGDVAEALKIVLAWKPPGRKMLTTLDVDESVLAEAQQMDLDVAFMELASCEALARKGVRAKKAEHARSILDALKRSGGDLDEATEAILAA